MKRIEQLLNLDNNQKRFNYLAKDIRQNRLVVFFGAGLSLWREYSKWKYPFCWTQARVERYFKILEKHYHEKAVDSSDVSKKLENIQKLIAQGKQQKKKDAFLEWGDTLDIVIQEMRRLYDDTGRTTQFPFSCFNDACVRAFQMKGAPPDFSLEIPYGIPAIYYLPFLCGHIITTNVDSSFEEVCSKIDNTNWFKQAIRQCDDIDFEHWNFPAKTILYIHGHINEPTSLIMTNTEYSEMYPEEISSYGRHRGARMVLNKTVKDDSILFLGASLQGDRTVQIINFESEQPETKKIREKKKLHFIPLAALQKNGNLAKRPQIINCEPVVYNQGMYGEIPILLLHLIRETTQKNDYCTWQKPNTRDGIISEETATLIRESLGRKDTIDNILIKNDDPDDVVRYLFEHHSIAKHDSGLGWSICRITDADFSLDGYHEKKGEPFSPLHNYPIGDTIYVLIRGNHLRWEEEDPIAQEISNWHNDTGFPTTRENDPLGDKEILPRIRIIRFNLNGVEVNDVLNKAENTIRIYSSQGNHLSYDMLVKLQTIISMDTGISMQELFSMLQVLLAKRNTRDIDIEGNTKTLTRTLKP